MHGVHSGVLKLAVTASVLLWASIAVTPAMAAGVTFNFQGAVLPGGDSGLFAALSPDSNPFFKGSITYDPAITTPSVGSFPTMFPNAIKAVSITFLGTGGYSATVVPPSGPAPNEITISASPPAPSSGPNGLNAYNMTASTGGAPSVGGFYPFAIQLDFIHGPGIFGNSNVPTLGSVFSPTVRLTFQQNQTFPFFLGSVSEITAVPLPPAVILFGAGLVALIGLGARNWRKQENGVA